MKAAAALSFSLFGGCKAARQVGGSKYFMG